MKLFRVLALLALALILVSPLAAAPLDAQAQQKISSGAAGRALWGIYAIDLDSGQVLIDIDGHRLHVPASNRKLVSTGMAAWLFEPDRRFGTEVRAPQHSGGVVNGDLVLQAAGDPSWTPALSGGRSGIVKLRDLARQVRLAGVERITGDVIIDTTRFADPSPLGKGWIWEDLSLQYGSRASVLALNHNLLGLNLKPGSVGKPVLAEWALPISTINLVNESTTGSGGSAPTLALIRDLGGHTVTLTGSLPAGSPAAARAVPVGDPVRLWGELFKYYLNEEGVKIEGTLRIQSRASKDGTVIAAVEGATIQEIVTECNRESDNYLAESLYLLASAERYGSGSYAGSYQLEEKFWKEIGVESSEAAPADGSGLSRENYITPHALVMLLKASYEKDWFVESLPESGRTGTLRYRLSQNGLAGRVRAKTGTLTGVSGLSGYVRTNSGKAVAFSILANNYTASSSTIRTAIDNVVEVLAAR